MPIPDKRELGRFCEIDGWEETEATTPDHFRYRKRLDNEDVLRTRVSHGRGPACDDPALWNRIWRHQLQLKSEDELWEVLGSGEPAVRGEPPAPVPEPQMDAWLFEALVQTVGVDETEVRGMGEEEAMARYLAYCERGGPAATKNQLSALIDGVRGGESVLIVDRGIPVARLESAVGSNVDADGKIARLERAGAVRRARKAPATDLLSGTRPSPRRGASVVRALLEDRRDGR